jgi:hypothetical protein
VSRLGHQLPEHEKRLNAYVVIASGHWYTSSAFWGPASGVMAVIVVGVISVWVALRIANPKKRLEYKVSGTPLLATQSLGSVEPGSVTVAYQGMPVTNPWVVTLDVWSVGRRDIRSSDFDDGRSLRFDLGAEIKATLDTTTRFGALTAGYPGWVELSPCLIRRGHVLTVVALTDGPPTLTYRNPLVDIEIRQARESASTLDLLRAALGGALPLFPFT